MHAVWGNKDRVERGGIQVPNYGSLRGMAVGPATNPYAGQQVRFGPGVAAGDENMYFAGLLNPGPVDAGLDIWEGGGGGMTGMGAICAFGEGCDTKVSPHPGEESESKVLPEAMIIGAPDIIDRERGGSAIWKQSTLWKRGLYHLARVQVSDEMLWCDKPRWHTCHVICWFYCKVGERAIKAASRLTPNVGYDKLSGWLWVRGNSLDVCMNLALWIKKGKGINAKGLQIAYDEGATMGAVYGWRQNVAMQLV